MSTQTRRPAGSPRGTGGQFGPASYGESTSEFGPPAVFDAADGDPVLADVDSRTVRGSLKGSLTRSELDRLLRTANRLDLYNRISGLPNGFLVATLQWPDQPDPDGRFKVTPCRVFDEDGNEVPWLAFGHDVGAAAGYFDDRPRTDYDLFRVDPDDPSSDIRVDRVRAWYDDKNGDCSEDLSPGA